MRGYVLLLLVFGGCFTNNTRGPMVKGRTTIHISVDEPEVHLGHSLDETGNHSSWYDGCRATLLDTNEPFTIYWANGTQKGSAIRLAKGQTYEVIFKGEMEDGVMGYQGKCIELQNVLEANAISLPYQGR